MIRLAASLAIAALTAQACAETPPRRAAQEPAAAPSPPIGSDASARSPMTVNPKPAPGEPVPATPPTLPKEPEEDKSMPPGPVNPGQGQ